MHSVVKAVSQIHFEIFARRAGGGSFSLQLALEDRERAIEAASELLDSGRFVAAKVVKETLDDESGEYRSVTILNKGAPERPKARAPLEDPGPPCVSPADLYNIHARDRIGRLLEGWLARNKATPFELLHRPDLIEKLDASGTELLHAIQKIAVPEAQARGVGVHEVMRGFQQLIQRAIDRVLGDQRKGVFPDLRVEDFAKACLRLSGEPERHYLIGAGVAGYIAPATTWADKVGLLLDLADRAPPEGPSRGVAFHALVQPLGEILNSRVGLADLLGADLDLGGEIAALTRLAAADAVEAVAGADATVARMVPPLTGPAERLGRWLHDPALESVRLALSKRVLHELMTQRWLRPSDPRGEIDILRALAMALTAASGPLLPLDEVRQAFIERSKMLVAADFVDAYLREPRPAMQEALDLVWLLENLTGGANKRQASRWLLATVTSLRFETELASAAESPSTRLARLADLHRQVSRAGRDAAGVDAVLDRIGEAGGRVEAEAKLTAQLVKAPAPLTRKLGALLKMATGEHAPPGPAADRARSEAVRLMRSPAVQTELLSSPDALGQIRTMMISLGIAA